MKRNYVRLINFKYDKNNNLNEVINYAFRTLIFLNKKAYENEATDNMILSRNFSEETRLKKKK